MPLHFSPREFLRTLAAVHEGQLQGQAAGQNALEEHRREQQAEALRQFQVGNELEAQQQAREDQYDQHLSNLLNETPVGHPDRARLLEEITRRQQARASRQPQFGVGGFVQTLPSDSPLRAIGSPVHASIAAVPGTQPDWYLQVRNQTASPTVAAPDLGATPDQVRQFGGLGATAAEVRAHGAPGADTASAASDLRNLIANPSQPAQRSPAPSPASTYQTPPARPQPTTPPARPAPAGGGQDAPFIDVPGVGPIHLLDLDPADRAQIIPQVKQRVDFLSSYVPQTEEESQAIQQALASLPSVIRTANDLAKAGQFLVDSSKWLPGESIAAQRLRAGKEASEAKAKAAAEAAATRAAATEATRKAREKAAADRETDRKQNTKLTYYQHLAAQAPGWAKLDPASQKQMFGELARAARDAGVPLKQVPSPLKLKSEATRAAATTAKDTKDARREYGSILARVTSPGFFKLPAEARPLLLGQLSDAAERAGVKIPASVMKSYRTAQIVDSRKKVGDKLSDTEKNIWSTSQRVLMAESKTASGSSKPRYSDVARSRALGVLQGLIKKHGLDPSLLDSSIAGSLKVTPATIGGPPAASTPAPPPNPFTAAVRNQTTAPPPPARKARPAPAAPSTPRVSPKVEGIVRGWISGHVFDQQMNDPTFQDPERRALAKRAYKQVTGRDWTGGK